MNVKYSFNEKLDVVNRICCGETAENLALELGITEKTITDWYNKYKPIEGSNLITLSHYNDLLRAVEKQKQLIAVLQAVDCNVHSPLQEKLCELEKLQGLYSVHVLCEALMVPRGTFYNHIKRNKRDNTLEAERKAMLAEEIKRAFEENRQIFGPAKITALLNDKGIVVSEKYVRRIMSELNLKSVRTNSKKEFKNRKKRENIVNQEFHTEKPNMVWVSDVTEFYFDGKKFYLCAILDLFSRKVIAYKISRNNSTHLVKMTAKKAFETRKPEKGLIFHSDNGSNYISKVFCKYLDSFGVERSYSKTQTPHDNAVMESFFSSLKREELYRREIKSEREFEKTVSDYIEFYNKRRPHKTIGQKAPDVFEEKYFESLDNAG